MSGAWTKDRKVWTPCQELRLIHTPGWVPREAQLGHPWGPAGEESPGSWPGASPPAMEMVF